VIVQSYTATAGEYARRADVQCFQGEGIFRRPIMEAKGPKILAHLFQPAADVTVWHDANVWLNVEPEAVATLLGDADIALMTHPYRETVWQEFAALREQKRFQIPWLQLQLKAQEAFYRGEGLPDDAPLYECTVIVRRNTEAVARLMDAWWSQICRWQWRDQVSLPYVLWKYGAGVKVATHAIDVRDHAMFRHVSQY
jgi:hypothetical protein